MTSALIIAITLVVAGYLAFSKRIRSSSDWSATVTPLASIMGSGFLISAPLLASIVGVYAIFCMLGLLGLAYGIGSAIRFNIQHFEPIENAGHGLPQSLALLSRVILTAAYFISISYYLQLLAAFALHAAGITNPLAANLLTSFLLLLIGSIGIWKGLGQLEKVERYAIGLNLGMVIALLVALLWYNTQLFFTGHWSLPTIESDFDWDTGRILLGLLIVVQGFETSRYIGDSHSADQRIKTMRRAQLISSLIYLLFIALATILFRPDLGSDVTAIITMTAPVAFILPFLLSIAAIGSQFSAAVADNSGASGLIVDLTKHRLKERYAYLLTLIVTIALTWETNVYQIISYASRAFACYYFLQCLVALIVAKETPSISRRANKLCLFGGLALLSLLVMIFGAPAE